MQINAIKTDQFELGTNFFEFIVANTSSVKEGTVLVVTSKIVALAEKNVVKIDEKLDKDAQRAAKMELVKQDSDYFLPSSLSAYNTMLTIKHNILGVNAGIDESNVTGMYVLLPKNPWQSAVKLWKQLRAHYGLENLGIIITDSRTFPLKMGVIGTALAYCGFEGLVDRRGDLDLCGRPLKVTTVNVAEALAAAAVLDMGEANEQTPLATITKCKFVNFIDHAPTKEELAMYLPGLEDDLYAPVVAKVKWHKSDVK